MEQAIFAGGCFWCMQPVFDKVAGVNATTVGYIGGTKESADYKTVCSGTTDHAEAILIEFDPNIVSYERLLNIFWRNIDPTTHNQQFVDFGKQYRTGIFYLNNSQKKTALESRQKIFDTQKFSKPIVTEIVEATEFYPAEEYHQKFYTKDPQHYKKYRSESGRDEFIACTWGGQ